MTVAANRRRLIPVPGRRRLRAVQVAAVLAVVTLVLGACSSGGSAGKGGGNTGTITVAVVDNPLMSTIEKLTPAGFTASHPGIKVKFVTLDENTLRDQVTKDVAAGGGQFDVVMIGPNDIPTWAKNGWVKDLTQDASDPAYDVNDIIKPVHDALSANGKLYAVPFYGESSFLMYRKDLLAAANLTMPANPTWDQVSAIAQKLNDPAKGMSGICLRGKTGWGENLASLDTVVNTFGGQWFNTKWEPQLTAPPFEQAVNFYVDLIKKAGEPGAANDSFNECLNNMQQSKSAMWYDATVAASTLDAAPSPIAGKLGFAPAPVVKTKASGWLWAWALSIEGSSKHQDAAWQFMKWATSKDYINYDAQKNGWAAVPPGTRVSTYQNPNYQKAASAFAALTLQSIQSVDVNHPGVDPQPYSGIQYVGIPEFADLGTKVSQEITAAIAGQESVSSALQKSQGYAQQVAQSYK
ncbi:MAG: polyol transport system substrate-binding protein [Pseudonocardiales bacterium]|jgi:sorbitol/mannitol transport system substrate-binding protein|nr:polyol transport system substrate-binding protein [Pseudonocardiales bacterium]